ncbi:hypothetical protein BpHYR1_002417 [Brachionus plicatilis]|uniref:Uncharacterized protein n=1 Tax=Brachionus plicatilis TaxID=10195 RepID=A0A3M7PV99_BRAPC|nr:hypothetical protein BpHYR1_002417 [Brachionus plicatilis]
MAKSGRISTRKGIESDVDSDDEVLSKRPRIESDQNEAFDSESKSCENSDSKMTKRMYWACPNKCDHFVQFYT